MSTYRGRPEESGAQPHAHHETLWASNRCWWRCGHSRRHVPVSGRRAAQDSWNPHQEPSQTEKAAKHGKMIKHGHFAEIASRQCFRQGVFHTTKTHRRHRPRNFAVMHNTTLSSFGY